MPFELNLTSAELQKLETISKSRTEHYFLINRAKIILDYSINNSIASASRAGNVVRNVVSETLKRVKELGVEQGIYDRKRTGRPKKISPESQAWVISLACQKPKELLIEENNPYEMWTLSLLAKYIRENCHKAGHPCLSMTNKGNLHNMLNKNKIKPHKIKYYLEKRDKNHEIKKKVFKLYRFVEKIKSSRNIANPKKRKCKKYPCKHKPTIILEIEKTYSNESSININQEAKVEASIPTVALTTRNENEINNFESKKELSSDEKKKISIDKRKKTLEINEDKIDKIFKNYGNTWEENLDLLEFKNSEIDLSKYEVISFDEKPGIQALENTARDLPPVLGKYGQFARDHEYKRHGTVDFICGINLINGHIFAQATDQHTSSDFINWLKLVDSQYDKEKKIIILLDNHSAHRSEETILFLNSLEGRFEFVFTPKHASWLNSVECFFSSMARTFLKNIRVKSLQELKDRIIKYIELYNQDPTIYQWSYNG